MTASSADEGWRSGTAVTSALLHWGNGVVPRPPP